MKRKNQRGSTMLESLFGMCFLLFLCFSLVELFVMIGRQMDIDYASFYGAKALALGYTANTCYKAVRIAGIPASGADISSEYKVPLQPSSSSVRSALRTQAARYMSLGRPSGVEYAFWYSDKTSVFRFGLSETDDMVRCWTALKNPEFLMEPMKKLMSLASTCCNCSEMEPAGECKMYNHAQQWMEE